jgi:hypothetical protein
MHRSKILPLLSICSLLTSCGYRQERLAEARKAIPSVRQYLIERITDLTKSEKEFIQNNEPFIGHANYAVYYFKWFDFSDEVSFTVETSGPPFRPYKAERSVILIDPAPCDSQSNK